MAWAPIPMGGKLLSVHGELHILGTQDANTRKFSAYGFSGELVPIIDPDAALNINTVWDNMVTKPVVPTSLAATSTVDFDFDSTSNGPDVEPGEVDVNDMTGLLDPNKSIMDPHIEWLSAAKGTPAGHSQTQSDDTYTPRSYKTFRSQRAIKADLSSYALLAISSPALDRDAVTALTNENPLQWAILENLHNVMNDFWRINVGMIESSAESPYSEISEAIGDLVSPDMINPSSTMLEPMAYSVLCTAEWLLDMPNSSIPNVLDAKNE